MRNNSASKVISISLLFSLSLSLSLSLFLSLSLSCFLSLGFSISLSLGFSLSLSRSHSFDLTDHKFISLAELWIDKAAFFERFDRAAQHLYDTKYQLRFLIPYAGRIFLHRPHQLWDDWNYDRYRPNNQPTKQHTNRRTDRVIYYNITCIISSLFSCYYASRNSWGSCEGGGEAGKGWK